MLQKTLNRFFRSSAHRIGFGLVLLALIITCIAPQTDHDTFRNIGNFASGGGNTIYLVFGIIVLLTVAYANKSRGCAERVVYAMLTVTVITQVLKFLTGNLLHILLRPSGKPGGFPSGHTSAACALAYLLTERMPRGAILWYGIAGLIGWSRLETGAHYPYQIISGAILGLAVGVIFSRRFPYRGTKGHELGADDAPAVL